MDIDFKSYNAAEYVLRSNIKIYDHETSARYQRAADMFTIFCQFMGVTQICIPHGDIINYRDLFAWRSDLNTYYHVIYNEYPEEYKEEQLQFENGMYLYCKWLDQIFYVAHPYRELDLDNKQYQEDYHFLNHWCDRHWDEEYECDYQRVDPFYSWHDQDVTHLYIVGTMDFMYKSSPALQAYKEYVNKHFSYVY